MSGFLINVFGKPIRFPEHVDSAQLEFPSECWIEPPLVHNKVLLKSLPKVSSKTFFPLLLTMTASISISVEAPQPVPLTVYFLSGFIHVTHCALRILRRVSSYSASASHSTVG